MDYEGVFMNESVEKLCQEALFILKDCDLKETEDYYKEFTASSDLCNKLDILLLEIDPGRTVYDQRTIFEDFHQSDKLLRILGNYQKYRYQQDYDITKNYERLNSTDGYQVLLNEMTKYPLLEEREPDFIRRAKNGDKVARTVLINSNLRLIMSIAKHYHVTHLTFLELIQEGVFGLIKAIDKFDQSKGYKFSTYATYWIRQAIALAIGNTDRSIRMPIHKVELLNKVWRFSGEYEKNYGTEPSLEKIAEHVEVPVKKLEELLNIEEVISLETVVNNHLSERRESNLKNFLADNNFNPEKQVLNNQLKEDIEDLLLCLTERERMVIILRFGLDDGQPKTLVEVALTLGISREGVRQIEHKALEKLKKPKNSYKVKEYAIW